MVSKITGGSSNIAKEKPRQKLGIKKKENFMNYSPLEQFSFLSLKSFQLGNLDFFFTQMLCILVFVWFLTTTAYSIFQHLINYHYYLNYIYYSNRFLFGLSLTSYSLLLPISINRVVFFFSKQVTVFDLFALALPLIAISWLLSSLKKRITNNKRFLYFSILFRLFVSYSFYIEAFGSEKETFNKESSLVNKNQTLNQNTAFVACAPKEPNLNASIALSQDSFNITILVNSLFQYSGYNGFLETEKGQALTKIKEGMPESSHKRIDEAFKVCYSTSKLYADLLYIKDFVDTHTKASDQLLEITGLSSRDISNILEEFQKSANISKTNSDYAVEYSQLVPFRGQFIKNHDMLVATLAKALPQNAPNIDSIPSRNSITLPKYDIVNPSIVLAGIGTLDEKPELLRLHHLLPIWVPLGVDNKVIAVAVTPFHFQLNYIQNPGIPIVGDLTSNNILEPNIIKDSRFFKIKPVLLYNKAYMNYNEVKVVFHTEILPYLQSRIKPLSAKGLACNAQIKALQASKP